MSETIDVSYDTRIPNNVGLSSDRRVLKALERWHPGYIDWWKDMGPNGFQEAEVYLRTAVSVDPGGWAKFDYVKMPEYRWGILLAPREEGRTIPFGEHKGQPAWQEVPGASSSARTSPGCSSVPRWWIEDMQKLRCQSGNVATTCSDTSMPGFHKSDPYPKTQSVILAPSLAYSYLRV